MHDLSRSSSRRLSARRGFTLVEILIVVIILGILAAIVIPQFSSASNDARKSSLTSQLQTVRSQLSLYSLQHKDELPPAVSAAAANAVVTTAWDTMVKKTDAAHADDANGFGPYLQAPPVNPLNGLSSVVIVTADVAAGATVPSAGWIVNKSNGKAWTTTKGGTKVYNEANPADPTNMQ